MKSESNIEPKKYTIENISNGKCDIVFNTNVEIIYSSTLSYENGEKSEEYDERYTYDTYRITTRYREDFEEILSNESNYELWLNFAREQEEKEIAKNEIDKIQEQLNNTDYKIVKCSEYQLAGLDMPYDIKALHKTRQELRNKINKLRDI